MGEQQVEQKETKKERRRRRFRNILRIGKGLFNKYQEHKGDIKNIFKRRRRRRSSGRRRRSSSSSSSSSSSAARRRSSSSSSSSSSGSRSSSPSSSASRVTRGERVVTRHRYETRRQVLYTVRRGDTLGYIACRQLGSARRYMEIYNLNRDVIRNPDLIITGQRIRLPQSSSTLTHAACARYVSRSSGYTSKYRGADLRTSSRNHARASSSRHRVGTITTRHRYETRSGSRSSSSSSSSFHRSES